MKFRPVATRQQTQAQKSVAESFTDTVTPIANATAGATTAARCRKLDDRTALSVNTEQDDITIETEFDADAADTADILQRRMLLILCLQIAEHPFKAMNVN